VYDLFHDFAGPVATIFASIVVARITLHFGRVQAQISQQQANIARQQAELARVRLRHDLYDRRFAIYDAARSLLLTEIAASTDVSDVAYQTFLRATADTRFLLPKDLSDIFEEMRTRTTQLRTVNRRLSDATERAQFSYAKQEERIENLEDEKEAIMSWFDGKFDLIGDKFDRILNLEILSFSE
jgi:hypothetical protein